jgi:hypothetical protein
VDAGFPQAQPLAATPDDEQAWRGLHHPLGHPREELFMADISSIGGSSVAPTGRFGLTLNHYTAEPRGTIHAPPGDRVDFSAHARMLGRIRALPETRIALVERVRAELATGRYESSDKLDEAVDQLLAELDA